LLASSWTVLFASDSDEYAPDDTLTAEGFNFSSSSGYIEKALSTPAESAQFDVWMRVASGTSTVALELHRAGPTLVASETATLSTRWTRYTLRGEHASGITLARINPASNDTIVVWGAKAGAVDSTLEARITAMQQLGTQAEFRLIGDYFPA
jgi:hypothetical protein